MELNELQQQRADKLARLRAAGVAGYPARSHRSHAITAVLADFDALMEQNVTVTVVGRVVGARRIMGKLAFAHIEDEHGRIQLWLSRADLGDEWFERFANDIDTFDIIQATGTLRRTKAGEASVFVTAMALLSKSINPPPDKWHGLTDIEARLRERYLDMIVNHDVRQNFRTRANVVRIMRRTVDLLAQIPYCEAISEQLRTNARAALKAINRFPVCEPLDLLAGGSGPNPATERVAVQQAAIAADEQKLNPEVPAA